MRCLLQRQPGILQGQFQTHSQPALPGIKSLQLCLHLYLFACDWLTQALPPFLRAPSKCPGQAGGDWLLPGVRAGGSLLRDIEFQAAYLPSHVDHSQDLDHFGEHHHLPALHQQKSVVCPRHRVPQHGLRALRLSHLPGIPQISEKAQTAGEQSKQRERQ